MFNIPTPILMSMQQQQQGQQFQPYQGSQSGPAPNPMQQPQQEQQNPLMQMMQQKGMQKLFGPGQNPMQGQAQGNPMAAPAVGQPFIDNSGGAPHGMFQGMNLQSLNQHTPFDPNDGNVRTAPNGMFGNMANAVKPQYVQGYNAPLANTQAAADSPFAGNRHVKPTPTPKPNAVPVVPNGPMPLGNQPQPFTPQAMTNIAPPQGIFPQWLQSLFH